MRTLRERIEATPKRQMGVALERRWGVKREFRAQLSWTGQPPVTTAATCLGEIRPIGNVLDRHPIAALSVQQLVECMRGVNSR